MRSRAAAARAKRATGRKSTNAEHTATTSASQRALLLRRRVSKKESLTKMAANIEGPEEQQPDVDTPDSFTKLLAEFPPPPRLDPTASVGSTALQSPSNPEPNMASMDYVKHIRKATCGDAHSFGAPR